MSVEHAFPNPKTAIESIGGVGDRVCSRTLGDEQIREIATQTKICPPSAGMNVPVSAGFFLFEPVTVVVVPSIEIGSGALLGARRDTEGERAKCSVLRQIRASGEAPGDGLELMELAILNWDTSSLE